MIKLALFIGIAEWLCIAGKTARITLELKLKDLLHALIFRVTQCSACMVPV